MSTSLYSLLQSAAAAHGNRTAIEFGDQSITYAAMLDRVDRLAGFLHHRGIRPGMHVALCFRKSIDAVVCLFGLNRTGAVYVPLDPAWPAHRIETICRDASIRHWLGTNSPPDGAGDFELQLTDSPAPRAVHLPSTLTALPMPGDGLVPPDDVCSLLYTSGSTGAPKGVRISGRSLLHFSRWAVDTFHLTHHDRVANHAPFHFDLSTLDVFGAVRAGATLCPVPDRIRGFPVELARFIEDRRISVWYSVPSVLAQIADRAWSHRPAAESLRVVLFAGEVMPKPAVIQLARMLPGARLANLYGPTETNVCTFHPVTPQDLVDDGPLPIGRPIDETRVWISDSAGRVDPALNAGELWVAGPTVAAGYHRVPQSPTAFVPAPDGIGYAYRTGDLVRRRDDGVLHFEGRIDRQIKARGHRVEPGEIEAVIAGHPAVREVAVVPIPDPRFGHRILACLASQDRETSTRDEIAAYCRSRLPGHMVPDAWLFQEALPRTDRGKIDVLAIQQLAGS